LTDQITINSVTITRPETREQFIWLLHSDNSAAVGAALMSLQHHDRRGR
jgi:hypothetical protein